MPDDRSHLITREHHRNIRSAFGRGDVTDFAEVFLENMSEEEQQRIERLILRGSRNIAGNRESGQERLDVLCSERRRVSVLSVPLEIPDPMAVVPQGLRRVMLCLDRRGHFGDCLLPLRLCRARCRILLECDRLPHGWR